MEAAQSMNIQELRIVNSIKESVESDLDEKIEYSVSKKINSIKNWIAGAMVATLGLVFIAVIFIVTLSNNVNQLSNKVDSFIKTQTESNNQFNKALLIIPEFDKQLELTNKNLEFVAVEVERISPGFKSEIITRGNKEHKN